MAYLHYSNVRIAGIAAGVPKRVKNNLTDEENISKEYTPAPLPVTVTSTCSWIGHSVSGLLHTIILALFRLALASAPYLKYLTNRIQ